MGEEGGRPVPTPTWKGLMSTGSANGLVSKPDMSAAPVAPLSPLRRHSRRSRHFRGSQGACATSHVTRPTHPPRRYRDPPSPPQGGTALRHSGDHRL